MLEKRKKEISHNLKIQPNLKNSNFIQLIENQRWIFSNSLIYIYIYIYIKLDEIKSKKKSKDVNLSFPRIAQTTIYIAGISQYRL